MQPGDQLSTMALMAETDLPETHLVLRETALLVATTDLPLSWKLLVTRVVDLHPDERLNAAVVCLFRAFEEASEAAKAKIKALAIAAPLQLQPTLKSLASKAAKLLKQEGVSSSPVSEIKKVLCFFQLYFCALPVTDYSTQPVVFAIFENASVRITHSCAPNCFILTRVLEDGVVLADVVTLKAIGVGEVFTVSYLPFTMLRASRGHRQRMLLTVRGFSCHSPCCVGGPDLRRRMPCAVCPRDATCWASEAGGVWTSSQCGRTSSEAPVSEEVEMRILKKVNIVQNLETVDFDKVMSVARPVIEESITVLGKKHFGTQIALQLLLLAKAQELTEKTSDTKHVTLEEFNAIVEDLVSFGLETDLPLLGMDEVANILTAPAILEAAASLSRSTEDSDRALACMRKFESFFFLAVGTIQSFQNPDQTAVVNKLVHLWFTLSRSPQDSSKLVTPVSTAVEHLDADASDAASDADPVEDGSAWRLGSSKTWAVLGGLGVAVAAAVLSWQLRSRRL